MRIIVWTLRAALLVVFIGFCIKNDELVTVHAWLGSAWQLPMSVLIFLLLASGVAVGVIAMLPTLIGLRRETSRLRKLRGEPAPQKSARPQYPESV